MPGVGVEMEEGFLSVICLQGEGVKEHRIGYRSPQGTAIPPDKSCI
jgi:hypothetical protein